MKPLYTQAEFDSAKSRDILFLECACCKQPFGNPKHVIQKAIAGTSGQKGMFCSIACGRKFINPPIKVICKQCSSPFQKQPKEIKKSKNNFCSQSCNAKWFNAHKTTGTRVSKLERWLQEQLRLLFPGLEFHFNRIDAIEAELDIHIPSLKLAFELNGIFHYEPIFGPEKFGRIQNNDERKMQACLERGIELCVIDISSVSYFKPVKAQKFLDIVVNLIRTKLPGDLPASSPLPSQNHVEVPLALTGRLRGIEPP